MRAIQILILGIFAAASGAASAGELGATSRGTVSISITVPPHLVLAVSSDREASSNALCVSSNAPDHYHIARLSADGTALQSLVLGARSPTRQSGAKEACGPIEEELTRASDSFKGDAADRQPGANSRPVTLLIVPD